MSSDKAFFLKAKYYKGIGINIINKRRLPNMERSRYSRELVHCNVGTIGVCEADKLRNR